MQAIILRKRSALGMLGRSLLLVVSFCALPALASSQEAPADASAENRDQGMRIDPYSWVDHDGYPLTSKPRERDPNLALYYYRETFVEPIARAIDVPGKILSLLDGLGVAEKEYESVNVNAFDEVSNSTWFTNRNHMKAVLLDEIRRGPENHLVPQTPWTITSTKKGGVLPGFQIKDAAGKKWVVKLDPPGYPQIGSAADVVSSRLLLAAGYNLPHDVALTFRRQDLTIGEKLAKGKDGGPPFTEDDLTKLLDRGHSASDGRYYGQASLFLAGEPIGPISLRKRKKDDSSDWYNHQRRRELRGLYVLASWLDHWDAKEHQSLDTFVAEEDSLGYVKHHLLDVGATLGAAAEGPKLPKRGFEYAVDFGWMGRRLVALGFLVEPWRRAEYPTGMPSVGNFESKEFQPDRFKTAIQNPAFQEILDGDGYWGAKIVASFSEAQIQAAIDAAGYEDPRARKYLLKTLVERQNKIARYWFGRVAPLDFFQVKDEKLIFHDLAVDLRLAGPREYNVEVEYLDGPGGGPPLRLRECSLGLGTLSAQSRHVRLRFSLVGSNAKPVTVELMQRRQGWLVALVRHA